MNDIIVATWGIGKTYRDRVKHNIRKAISTGYDKVLPYVILTDDPDYFQDLVNETDLVKKVININDERRKYSPWSFDLEYIPDEGEDGKYGNDYRNNNYRNDKIFSYGLNRFSLPTISDMGYKKFIMCDSDTDIRYDKIVNNQCTEEDFWKEYDTPVSSMKGCDLELFHMNRDCPEHSNGWARGNIVMANILRYHFQKKYPHLKKVHFLSQEYTQTEGPFRYYNLDSSQKVMEVFKLWNEGTEMMLSDDRTRWQLKPGGYMFIDNVLFTVASEMLDIKIMNFDKFWHTVNIYIADRHFYPKGNGYMVDDKILSFMPADTKEEFYQVNHVLINHLIDKGEWID